MNLVEILNKYKSSARPNNRKGQKETVPITLQFDLIIIIRHTHTQNVHPLTIKSAYFYLRNKMNTVNISHMRYL